MPDIQELVTPQSSLVDTVKEQQGYVKNVLVVKSLEELMDPLRLKTKVDLYELRRNNYNGQAKENIDDNPFLSKFFQSKAKDRKYYEFHLYK